MNKTKNQPKTLKEKICIFFVLLGMSSVLYFIATGLTEKRAQEIEFIKKNPH
jgi:hypothetical protein